MNFVEKYDQMNPCKVSEGITRRIIKTANLMLANVEFSDGPNIEPDPFHSHHHEQVSYISEGEIYLFVDNEEKVRLKAGDHFAIPSGMPHTIQRLTKFVRIIDCFTPIREDFL
jgi:quercetin dioxygenase-like cupin family protein